MNSLSAIRPGGPDLRAPSPSAVDPARLGPASISAAELQKLSPTDTAQSLAAPPAAGGSFSNVLGRMIQEVNAKQAAAGQAVQGLQSGQAASLHQAMIALEEASVSFQLMVQVRNKLLESYQELMRMQV